MKPLNDEFDLYYDPDLIDGHLREAREIRAQYLNRYAAQLFTAVKVKIQKLGLVVARASHQTMNGTLRVIDPETSDKPGKRSYT